VRFGRSFRSEVVSGTFSLSSIRTSASRRRRRRPDSLVVVQSDSSWKPAASAAQGARDIHLLHLHLFHNLAGGFDPWIGDCGLSGALGVASDQASEAAPEEGAVSRTNRQEEAWLVTYVNRALQEIYLSDANAEEHTFVFDVHSLRKGSSFENADLIAVHWRSRDICELIAVEVKLEFSAQAVQQALSYTRFAHRAWIAVLVETDSNLELHERNPMLFEYAISRGLGILACRRSQGRGYKVFPVHWPLRHQPDLFEENEFLERYRNKFEEAGILQPRRQFPRLR
jgi:hypothetical protein